MSRRVITNISVRLQEVIKWRSYWTCVIRAKLPKNLRNKIHTHC